MNTRHLSRWSRQPRIARKTESIFLLSATIYVLALCSALASPLTVMAANSIAVRVICNGVFVANAEVKLYRIEANGERQGAGEARTDQKGKAQISKFDSGTYELQVVCSDGPPITYKFSVGVGEAFTHSYSFRCCPPGDKGPNGLSGVDGRFPTEAETGNTTTTSKPAVTATNGLKTISFNTDSGRVIVNLPDDMRAGDTISGTVKADPKGQTPEERTKNMAVLTGCVIEIEPPKKPDGTSNPKVTAQVTAALSPFTFTLPPSGPPAPPLTSVSSGSSGGLGITLTNTSGSFSTGSTQTVPIEIVSLSLQSVAPLTVFQLPTIGQQGRPVEISGPFQVNGGTTLMYGPPGASVQDFEKNTENLSGGFGLINPIAQSPRKCVFEAPPNVTGPIELYLKEGNIQTKGEYRNVGVNLTAPKTSLLKGESTDLHVEVTGLQGLTQPVPLTLESHGVITMVGGMYQQLTIQPSQVGADGRYSTTRGVTGVQAGVWGTTATVVTGRFDFCLQDESNPRTVVLVNSFTGNYLFPLPGGTSLSGTGTVTRQGCTITLTDRQPDRRVQGNIDPCTQTGSASVQVVSPKVKFTIIDRNMTNNTCAVP